MEGSETKRFVLVHGGGFGAWCWYKTITLLEKHGFQVDAVELTGSGVSSIDTNNITSLAHYSKPLLHFFESLKPTEKVPTLSYKPVFPVLIDDEKLQQLDHV